VAGSCASDDRWNRPVAGRRCDAVERQVVGVGGRATVAERQDRAATRQPAADRARRLRDRVALLSCHALPQRRIVGRLCPDRGCHLAKGLVTGLLLAPEKRVEEAGFAHVVAQLAALEEDVHRLPQRVIQDFQNLLVDEGMVDRRADGIGAAGPRQRKRHRAACACGVERGFHLGIARWRAEAHHDVFGPHHHVETAAERHRQVERRQRALADDHRVHELHGHVLRVGGAGAATEREQPAAVQEALRHRLTGRGQAVGLAREERFAEVVSHRQGLFHAGGERAGSGHGWPLSRSGAAGRRPACR
jgi:hypothetical protein